MTARRKPMNERQRFALDFITQFIRKHGCGPTLREIKVAAEAVGHGAETSGEVSISVITKWVQRFIADGHLQFTGAKGGTLRGLTLVRLPHIYPTSSDIPAYARPLPGRYWVMPVFLDDKAAPGKELHGYDKEGHALVVVDDAGQPEYVVLGAKRPERRE